MNHFAEKAGFCLHSIGVEILGADAQLIADDFEFYRNTPSSLENQKFQVHLKCIHRSPLPLDLPNCAAERIFSECVLYRERKQYFYEYSGAVLQVDRNGLTSSGTLITKEKNLRRELAYLYLQSEIGRLLDAQGLHRVHALGIGLPSGKAVLVLLPSGGGKSTMALELMKQRGCVLLSDDSPLIDRKGKVHPFPLRLGFRPQAKIPDAWREKSHTFERRKHGSKILVPITTLPEDTIPETNSVFKPGFLVIGKRHGQNLTPSVTRVSSHKGVFPLFRDMVVGLGIAQVAELVLADGLKSLPRLLPTAVSRARAAAHFSARATTLYLNMSRDPEVDARFLWAELAKL